MMNFITKKFQSIIRPSHEHPFVRHRRIIVAMLAFSFVLSACTDEDSNEGGHNTIPGPSLYQFHITDTYNTNTEFDQQTELAISPSVNFGHFEVSWALESDEDYFVELRINDLPFVDGSRLISGHFCGPDYSCHQHQYKYCRYTNSLNIQCEDADGNVESAGIGDLLFEIPQDMYLIMQACDSSYFYCEYQSRHVSIE